MLSIWILCAELQTGALSLAATIQGRNLLSRASLPADADPVICRVHSILERMRALSPCLSSRHLLVLLRVFVGLPYFDITIEHVSRRWNREKTQVEGSIHWR